MWKWFSELREKAPFYIRFETDAGFGTSLGRIWKATDYVFRFVQWCIVAGVIRFARVKTGNWAFVGLEIALIGCLYMVVLQLMMVRVAVYIRAAKETQRRAQFISTVSALIVSGFIGLVAYCAVLAVFDALMGLQALR